MADGQLKYEDGLIRLGSRDIPGILKRLTVRGEIRFDRIEQDQKSGSTKTPMGWDDCDINIVFDLLTDDTTCYEKLEIISNIYKGYDNGANPKIYTIFNSHIEARGIYEVVFCGLESVEDDTEDIITATLRFQEHNPPVIKVEKAAKNETVNNNINYDQPDVQPVADATIMKDETK